MKMINQIYSEKKRYIAYTRMRQRIAFYYLLFGLMAMPVMANPAINAVALTGTFNDWNPSALWMQKSASHEIYYTTIPIQANETILFKFLAYGSINNQGAWFGVNAQSSLPIVKQPVGISGSKNISVTSTNAGDLSISFYADTYQYSVSFREPSNIQILGNFNDWQINANPMLDSGNNLYVAYIPATKDTPIEFKLNGNAGWLGEDNQPTQTAPFSGNLEYLGTYPIKTIPTNAGELFVTYEVGTRQYTLDFSPITSMYLVGSFNDWNPTEHPMTSLGDGNYETWLAAKTNGPIEFKILGFTSSTNGTQGLWWGDEVNTNAPFSETASTIQRTTNIILQAIEGTIYEVLFNKDSSEYSVRVSPLTEKCTPQELQNLLPNDGESKDYFGQSVAIAGNIAVVGAYADDDSGIGAGAIYAFDLFNGEQLYKYTPEDVNSNDYFGYSIAAYGNVAVIGAPWDDNNDMVNSGSAYVIDLGTQKILYKFRAGDVDIADIFGYSVSASDDLCVIGAYYKKDENRHNTGAAYVFDLANGEQLHKLLPDIIDGSAYFGCSVAISDNRIVIGAYADDNNYGNNSGAAYVFDVTTGEQLFKLLPDDGASEDNFGQSVSVANDLAIISAPGGYSKIGSAYIFNIKTGEQLHKLVPEGGASYNFGLSVSISQDICAVSSYDRNTDTDISYISIYVFDLITGQQIEKFSLPDNDSGGSYGASLALSENWLVVGTLGANENGEDSGSAFVYQLFCDCNIDAKAPVLNGIPQNTDRECVKGPPNMPNVMALDNCDTNTTVTFEEFWPNNCTGTLIRTWTSSDLNGNTTSATQYITILNTCTNDTEPPELIGVSSNIILGCDEEVPDAPIYTTYDNCDTNVPVVFNEQNSGACPREIIRTWTATDKAGNVSSVTQNISMIEIKTAIICPEFVGTYTQRDSGPCGTGGNYNFYAYTNLLTWGNQSYAAHYTRESAWVKFPTINLPEESYIHHAYLYFDDILLNYNASTRILALNHGDDPSHGKTECGYILENVDSYDRYLIKEKFENNAYTNRIELNTILLNSLRRSIENGYEYWAVAIDHPSSIGHSTYSYMTQPTLVLEGNYQIDASCEPYHYTPPEYSPDTHYVKESSQNSVYPYTNWSTAANVIQDAVFASSDGDTILVTNGVYRVGGASFPKNSLLSNRVYIDRHIDLKSVNGPSETIIVGGIENEIPIRCVFLGYGATISGFTLTGGIASTNYYDGCSVTHGGGIFSPGTGPYIPGFGDYDRSYNVSNCVISSNAALFGGGVYGTRLKNCILSGNSAEEVGGGGYITFLSNCTITSNIAVKGGGVYKSSAYNCLLEGNSAEEGGGGAYESYLYNSILIDNLGKMSGDPNASGGGAYQGELYNCILYGNVINNYSETVVSHCNTKDPQFNDEINGDYRLKLTSPCIDAGINQEWMKDATDFKGNKRIMNGRVDIGTYEYGFETDIKVMLEGAKK